jgi:predicted nucleic acid-binding protein
VTTGTLIDTGPLVALIDRSEAAHRSCIDGLAQVQAPVVTTWPVVTEAMHLVHCGGWHAQKLLWELLEGMEAELAPLDTGSAARMKDLMERYRDAPMSLADASLVAAAEERGIGRVFTLDAHFHAYRARGHASFEILPGG